MRAWYGLAAIAVLGASLHAVSIARTLVPAQDGLKFIRAAKAFPSEGFLSAVRSTDQHPLYPALIAGGQPVLGWFLGPGPDSWRLAAQGVSAAASLGCLVPLHLLTRRALGKKAGLLAALLYVLLPVPMEIGHDTVSDPLALFLMLVAFERGVAWLEEGSHRAALGCGLAAGIGYWARPEVLLAGVVLALVGAVRAMSARRETACAHLGALSRTLIPMLALVGSYTLAKGEASEKLALRLGVGLPPSQPARVEGARDQTVISPKEEADPVPMPAAAAALEVLLTWLRVTGVLIAPLVIAGAWLAPPSPTRIALRLYLVVFAILLVRHLSSLGYLSMRHVLAPVVLGLPWAGWRLGLLIERVGRWLRLDGERSRVVWVLAIALMIAGGLAAQAKPSHPSRWGHWAAGRWLAANMGDESAVLDTRGWASFVADRPSYGPWHFRQAESDARLAFVVLERNELTSGSERSRQLAGWLDGRAALVAEFPDIPGDAAAGTVQVYQWLARRAAERGT